MHLEFLSGRNGWLLFDNLAALGFALLGGTQNFSVELSRGLEQLKFRADTEAFPYYLFRDTV